MIHCDSQRSVHGESGPTGSDDIPIDMNTNFVLVDFENVQPKNFGLIKNSPFQLKLFLGPNQAKIPVELASTIQSLGTHAEYVIVETSGKNALDLHIAYYIGVLSIETPKAHFYIISKDTGFDSLIRHLKQKKIIVHRYACISEIPFFKPAQITSPEEQYKKVVADLVRLKTSRPRTKKTLLSTLNSLFGKKLTNQQLDQLFSLLCQRGIVNVDGAKVSYKLPKDS